MKKRMAPQNHPIKLVSSVFPILMSMLESFFDIRKDSRKLPLSRRSARTRNFVAKNCRRDKNMPTPPQSIINGLLQFMKEGLPFFRTPWRKAPLHCPQNTDISLYSSFAEQCACYPYIFPTIFPRAAAGRSLHKRLRNLYCAPAT